MLADLALQAERMLGKPPLVMFAAGGKTVQKFSEYIYKYFRTAVCKVRLTNSVFGVNVYLFGAFIFKMQKALL